MLSKNRKSFILNFVLILALVGGMLITVRVQAEPFVYRVASDGAVSGSCGADWSNPCDLQYVLPLLTAGGELWLKEGTYKPGNDRNSTFQLRNGVAIYGGFAGTETSREQRDPSAHITILSGDLNGDDSSNIAHDEPTRAENVLHVVVSGGVDNSAILDGFTITGGNANLNNGTHTARGGGMWNGAGNPTITNVIFAGNSSLELGGGMYNENNSSPILTNVTFTNNSSEGGGGLTNYRSSPTLTNVKFNNNAATYSGGGALNVGESNPTFVNVTIVDNSAFSFGGGISNYNSTPRISNSTFHNNHASGNPHPFHTFDNTAPFGGGLYNTLDSSPILENTTISGNTTGNSNNGFGGSGIGNQESSLTLINVTISGNSDGIMNDSSHTVIRNSVIWGNVHPSTGDVLTIYDDLNSSSTVSDSVIQNGFPSGTNIITTDPLLGTLGDYGGSTQTIPLSPGSSAIDQGNAAYCPTTDQRGVTRPQGAACDIGAYEYQALSLSPGETIRVSVDSNGAQGDGYSDSSSISADGRYIAFKSHAANLVSSDTNGTGDIFVHDIQLRLTTRVSVNSSGVEANDESYTPSISADGRYIVFSSLATNLVPGDTNGGLDVFVHDRQVGTTSRLSIDSNGIPANGGSSNPSISADGVYVAFESDATNLVPEDTNGEYEIFVHNMQTGMTRRVSVNSSGAQANSFSALPSISSNGRFVSFYSNATNLVPGDTNGVLDIFVHDLQVGTTTRVSIDSNGLEANGSSYSSSSVSADSRYVVFASYATNLAGECNISSPNIFLHDMQMGITTCVSVNSSGEPANGGSYSPFISGDGRYVAFESYASNLVLGSTSYPAIYMHDLQTGLTTLVSINLSGISGVGGSFYPSISSDGSYIAFYSDASNLVPDDTNSQKDIFVHRQEILSTPPTPTPTFTNTPTVTSTSTYTPTSTSTATTTPTSSQTPVPNCNQITAGPLTMSGDSMSMSITNPLTLPIQIQDVFVVWNNDKGHLAGGDKTLQLNSASLGSQFWSGISSGPSHTIIPSPTAFIPTGTSTITFTFHQSYDDFDGTEHILINLATNGCQSYPIVSNSIATNTPTATFTPTYTFTPTATSVSLNSPLYLSLTGNQTIGGVTSADEDILKFDGTNWSLFFDGSDVGVGGSDLFGFSIVDSDTILMAFSSAVTVNGLAIAPQDVVRFEATSLGTNTAGAFHMYLDGSDVGLDTTAEKLDSVSLFPDGRVLISTTGNPAVVGVTGGRDEDILAFTPTSLGEVTSGTWAMYFDGSDVGLGETSGEDVDALDVVNGKIYLSTVDNFLVNGVAGADEDIFFCNSFTPGDVTTCSYSSALYFDGSTWNLSANDVDAFNFLSVGPVPTNTPTHTPTATNTSTATFTPTNTPTRTPTTTITPTLPRGVFEIQILSHEPHPSNPGEEVTIAVSVSDIGGGPVGNVTVNIVSDEGYTSCITVDMGNSSVCSGVLKFNNSFGHLIRASVGGDYADVDHYVNPVSTNTPTHTPTAPRTPTFTPTATLNTSDLIFKDGFEAGNLSAWTSNTNDLGDLSVSPSAALVGTQGLQAVIDDANTIYVTDDTPNAEPRYRARFYLDPNSITMASGDAHFIFKGFMGTATDMLQVELRNSAGAYQIRGKILNDASAFVVTNWFTISDASHVIEVDWRAAMGVGANNGGLTLWIDGVQQQDLTGVDNDTSRIDRVRLGALAGMDAGTSGVYYFDAFESRRQNYIGP